MCGRAERCDEEGVSIDTICTHSLSPSIVPISSASPSLHLALHAVVPGCSSPPAPSPAPPRSAASQSHKSSLIAVAPGQCMTWDQSSVDLQSYSRTILNRVTNGFATAVSRVMLGGKRQTKAFSAVSRRDLSGKLTWGARRRRAGIRCKVKTPQIHTIWSHLTWNWC